MKKLIIALLLIFSIIEVNACTTFVMNNDNGYVFGRNLDWVSDNGIVMINKRGVQKQALLFTPEKPAQWTSKYGSVSFNQFGKDFPFGGINETGLVVEIMLAKAKYPSADKRAALNELQWVQYQLDNSSSIEDVIASDNNIRISMVNQELHFLITDKTGNTAVIEFRNNKMQVYSGENLPIKVLENDIYSKSLLRQKKGVDCRFASVCSMLDNFQPGSVDIVDYSFNILTEVALSVNASWSIVYDIGNMKIHFKTASIRSIREIDLTALNFECNNSETMYDLKWDHIGEINSYFVKHNEILNENVMKDAVRTNQIMLPKHLLSMFYGYSNNCINE
jgi:hypothetical protein